MEREKFEELVAASYEKLPEWVRGKIKNVALIVEDEPSEEVCEAEGLGENETLLGYYQGIPLTARGENYGFGAMPDTIHLYQWPIEDAAAEDGVAVEKVIEDTIWHEFAHHFGMSEAEVRHREKERGIE